MTLEHLLYRKLFADAYWEYAYDTMNKRRYIVNQTQFKDEVKLALLYIYLEMILTYYRDLDIYTSDDNLFTVTEIKGIIDTFNDIAGSDICYQSF